MASAFTILMAIILFLILLSWVLHWAGVTYTNPDTKKHAVISAAGILDLFYAPVKGFEDSSGIIIFILCIGAFIHIAITSQAPHALSQRIAHKLKNKEIWLVPILILFFGILGTVEGFCEESLGFYLLIVPLMVMAGFDTFTGFMIVLVGAGAGVMGSTVNPFAITVAFNSSGNIYPQHHAPIGNGLAFRALAWGVIMFVATAYVMWYALRVKKHNEKSVTFHTYEADKKYFVTHLPAEIEYTTRRKWTNVVFAFAFAVMIFYLVDWDALFGVNVFERAGTWVNDHLPYITTFLPGPGHSTSIAQVGTFFIIFAIIIGFINWQGEPHFINNFMKGAADILGVCLIIAIATGLGFILTETGMKEMFVGGLKSGIGHLSRLPRFIILYFAFIPLSFLVPSSSGFAKAFMPILGPVLGVHDFPGGVATYAWSNGLVNIMTPTSAVLMGGLAISRVSYNDFVKGIWPLWLMLFLTGFILLCIGTLAFPATSNVF